MKTKQIQKIINLTWSENNTPQDFCLYCWSNSVNLLLLNMQIDLNLESLYTVAGWSPEEIAYSGHWTKMGDSLRHITWMSWFSKYILHPSPESNRNFKKIILISPICRRAVSTTGFATILPFIPRQKREESEGAQSPSIVTSRP